MTFRKKFLAGFTISAIVSPVAVEAAVLTPVVSLTGSTVVSFTDAVGTTYTGNAVYSAGANSVTFNGGGQVLERDQVDNTTAPYLDSNFATATQLIAECGFTAALTCTVPTVMSISFATPITAFSIAADDFDTTQTQTFALAAYNGSTQLGLLTASSLADSGSSPATFTATSSIPITSIQITDAASSVDTGDFVVGDVLIGGTAGVTPVPEPAAFAVLGVGLASLLGVRRRRV